MNTHINDSSNGLSPMTPDDQRRLAGQVLAITDELAYRALDGAWDEVFDLVERRRALLQSLEEFAAFSGVDSALAALRAAVTESEQAVTRVIAHAIANRRQKYLCAAARH